LVGNSIFVGLIFSSLDSFPFLGRLSLASLRGRLIQYQLRLG